MASSQVVLVFLALGSVGGIANKVSPVQKVIQLIDDMSVKVQKDLDVTIASFEEFAKFCDDEVVAKTHSTDTSKDQIDSLTASIDDSTGRISQYESQVEELTSQIGAGEGDLAQALSVRTKDHDTFISTEKEMLNFVESLNVAADTLKKSLGLVQLTPEAQQGLDNVLASMKQIVEASFVTHEQRSKVEAFMQAKEDSEFTVQAHDSNSIITTLEDMTAKAEATLTDTRRQEMQDAHGHALLKQGMESSINSMRSELSETTKAKQFTTETRAVAQNDLAVGQRTFNDDSKYLKDLKRDCQARALQFEEESKDGNAELTALSKAKGILAKKFSALIQTTVQVSEHDDDDTTKAQALRKIEQLGQKFHSTALVALAFRASADPIGKAKSLVEGMIAKLQQEAAEEASQQAFCDEEMGKSQKSKSEKEESISRTQARIDKADATVAKMTEAVATLSKEVAQIDSAVADATALREKEKTEFSRQERDYSESEEACAAATSALREYYEGAALIQVKSNDKVTMKGDSSGILGVLEVAESDFARLLAETRSTEQAAADEFKKMIKENTHLKATTEVDMKGKQSELKSLKTALSNYHEDKDGVTTELNAVNAYLATLKPQCETNASSYAERKAEREQEIAGLKEGLALLSGDGVALVQTSHHLRGQ